MSRFWGYSKRPKNWHKLLREELTDEELDKAVIVAKYKSLPPEEKPKISATVIEKPNISATVIRPINLALPGSASPVNSVTPDSSTSY